MEQRLLKDKVENVFLVIKPYWTEGRIDNYRELQSTTVEHLAKSEF